MSSATTDERTRLREHSSRRVSEASRSMTYFPEGSRVEVDVFGPAGRYWRPGTVLASKHNPAHGCVVVRVRFGNGEERRIEASRVREAKS